MVGFAALGLLTDVAEVRPASLRMRGLAGAPAGYASCS